MEKRAAIVAEARPLDQEAVRFIQMIGATSVGTVVTTQGTVESTEEEDVGIGKLWR